MLAEQRVACSSRAWGADFFKPMDRIILLTNDDGITSHGLWAAADVLSSLGRVIVTAPRAQASGSGRSFPGTSDGKIEQRTVLIHGAAKQGYAVGGSPAQVVLHGLLEILPNLEGLPQGRKPDLVVSGINYGENVGSGVTASGTVGAALEAASVGIPSLAISLETEKDDHFTNSDQVDFTSAAYFTRLFSEMMLEKRLPEDVQVLKVDIPAEATPATPWQVTRLSRQPYFISLPPERSAWDQPAVIGYDFGVDLENEPEDTDVHTLRVKRHVSATPLSLDLTSRVKAQELERLLRE